MADDDYKPGSLPYPTQDERKLFFKFHYKGLLIVVIPLVFAPLLFWNAILPGRMIYVSIVIFLYYILNLLAQGAVAFMFIALLPLFSIMSSKPLCVAHYADVIFTTYGSVFLGIMMDSSKLSDRLAIITIRLCGANIRLLQIVLMLLTAFVSIFVCNTFTAAVFMKIAQAVVAEYANADVLVITTDEETYERQAKPYPSLPVIGIYLSVAYAATLGGMVSPFQEPNGVIASTMSSGHYFVHLNKMMLIFLIPMILGLIVTFLWINIIFFGLIGGRVKEDIKAAAKASGTVKQAVKDKNSNMGPWSIHSILASVFLIITAILLASRSPRIGLGWADSLSADCGSSVVIIFICIIVFAVAANYMFCRYYGCTRPAKEGTSPSLVGWKVVNANTPWGHIFMLTAGLGFIAGYKQSLLMETIHSHIAKQKYGKGVCFIIGTLLSTLLTSLASATVVASETLRSLLRANGHALAIPYAAALHNQFLLPISTPVNTIVAGWGNIRPFQFLLGGIVPALAMILFIGIVLPLGDQAFSTGFTM